ncbi:MAG: low molecular weight phosphotyrosine protein phosphatase [Alloprevotella sp.]|nr:low molecular weight phosphotyrosine protein phosphatase [Alloprevotella sp.]MBR1652287.1 low molecular weight phosphotyrosine protein phosphatase [Alloprevotella sp.]
MNEQHASRILFVCLGNICRSSAAEEIFRRRAEAAGLAVEVDSAGLIDYHEGELSDPRMLRHAAQHGYTLTHRSRPVRTEDFRRFDLIVAMDAQNVRGLRRMEPADGTARIVEAAGFLSRHRADSIPDPYYSGDAAFEHVIDLLEDVAEGLVRQIGG